MGCTGRGDVASKGKRGTEVPRPFGFAHKGASALIRVCRTVGAIAPVSETGMRAPSLWRLNGGGPRKVATGQRHNVNEKAPRPMGAGPRRRCKQPLPEADFRCTSFTLSGRLGHRSVTLA